MLNEKEVKHHKSSQRNSSYPTVWEPFPNLWHSMPDFLTVNFSARIRGSFLELF